MSHRQMLIISTEMHKCITAEEQYSVRTRTVTADFTQTTGLFERISRSIDGLDIGVLGMLGLANFETENYFL